MDLSLLLTDALAQTTFSRDGVFSPEDLRSMSDGGYWGSAALQLVLEARTCPGSFSRALGRGSSGSPDPVR